MHITWDEPHHEAHAPTQSHQHQTSTNQHRKLKKKVSFAAAPPPATSHMPAPHNDDTEPLITPFDATLPPLAGLEKTATGGGKGGLKSAFAKLSLRKPPASSNEAYTELMHELKMPLPIDEGAGLNALPPSPTSSISSEQSWHHHDSYFPEYEPIFASSSSTAASSDPSSDYAYIDPLLSAMTPLELQQEHHNAVLGKSVIIHYPDLPAWSDYGNGGEKAGWYTGRWGNTASGSDWTGYGWEGEKLPTADGAIFGVPMKEGIPIVTDEKQGGGGGGGGGGGEGGEGGEGGGGGKKKKKK